jgi:hypothetical protein
MMLVASDSATLEALLSRLGSTPAAGLATTRSRLRHDIEGPRFREWMQVLDTEGPETSASAFPLLGLRGERFFSGNMSSLSETLQSVTVEEIESETRAGVLTESVRYKIE